MTDVIVIDKLTKSFKGKTVLEDVNMRLQEGRIYGIVGDNGSGKTVLLKLICGFMKPDSGTVTVNASGDGLDSNGALTINGGTVYVSGPTGDGNGTFDCDGVFTINGGVVLGTGSSGSPESGSGYW